MKRKKVLYLNRTVIWMTMIGYISLMILLLFMDWYLIGEYQRENRERGANVLQSYMDKTEEAMGSVEGILREVYLYDADFTRLADDDFIRVIEAELEKEMEEDKTLVFNSEAEREALVKVRREAAEFDCTYRLTQNLRNRLSIDESLHGYYLFYRNFERCYYGVDLENIKATQSRTLQRTLKDTYAGGQKIPRNWTVINSGDENLCLIVFYQKGAATLFGAHSLENAVNSMSENMGKSVDVYFVQDGFALNDEQQVESLGLSRITQDFSEIYSGRIKNRYVYGQRLKNTGLWIFMSVNYNIWSIMNLPQMLLLLAAVASVFCVVGLLLFMKKELVYPLRQLTDSMNHIRVDSDYEIPQRSFRFRELQEVNDTLSIMIKEIEKQKMRTYEEIIEKQKATMQYLQLQLKPHFYLNGLKTLNALAMENKTDKMQELILSLSAHMRYLLQTERETIPLFMELEFVENYVNLQKHVTGRRVECHIHMDEDVRTWIVPVLCVQTFVENSIKYVKFGSMNVLLEIEINTVLLSTEDGRFLDLTVSDNGQGYPENILEEINGDSTKGSRSVGINNIKRRCRILYGDTVEYLFYNHDGAVSEIILPEVEANESVDRG